MTTWPQAPASRERCDSTLLRVCMHAVYACRTTISDLGTYEAAFPVSPMIAQKKGGKR